MKKELVRFIEEKVKNFPVVHYQYNIKKRVVDLSSEEYDNLSPEVKEELEKQRKKNKGEGTQFVTMVGHKPINHVNKIKRAFQKIMETNRGLKTVELQKIALNLIIASYYHDTIQYIRLLKE